MSLQDLFLAHGQPGYERALSNVAKRWTMLMGSDVFEGQNLDNAVEIALSHAEARVEPHDVGAIAADLSSLVWWCGAVMDAGRQARLGRAVRGAAGALFEPLKFPDPSPAKPRRRALWTGALQSPHHSPSRGAADLAAAILADPKVTGLDLYHGGSVGPEMNAYLLERLGPAVDRLAFITTDGEDHWASVVERGPYIHHVWCDYGARLHLALASRMGPTLMYACGDQPPLQHADVYWFYHRPDYIAGRWAEEGAPAGFAGRYVEAQAGPHNPALQTPAKALRERFGLPADKVILTTVGNRLAVDFDQTFVDGLGGLIAADPNLHWRVVGALPEWLSSACSQVLGAGFSHQPFENDLASFMTTVDLFANPFRRGGGDTAVTAMLGGCVVVAQEAGDVGGLVPPDHRLGDADDYFTVLGELASDPALRAAWAVRQHDHIGRLTDQTLLQVEIGRMETLALKRFMARRGRSPWSLDDASPPLAADAGVLSA